MAELDKKGLLPRGRDQLIDWRRIMGVEPYEYHAVFDRNFNPLASTDKYSVKIITDEVNKKCGKGWVYAGIVPLAALVTGETQHHGFCYLFKRPQVPTSPKDKVKRKR
ncbi:MAG: hypothetical protein ABJB49_03300 [Nitrospirota bacterium]